MNTMEEKKKDWNRSQPLENSEKKSPQKIHSDLLFPVSKKKRILNFKKKNNIRKQSSKEQKLF